MADEPTDLILHRLKRMDEKLDGMNKEFSIVHEELRDLRDGQEEFLKNSVFAMGNAAGARHRVDELEVELDDIKRRLSQLEENA